MTCIVGLVDSGAVYIGGDSSRVSGKTLRVRSGFKVFRNGEFLFGCAGSIRVEQLLHYKFTPPPHGEGVDPDCYMATDFVDAVREVLEKGGTLGKFTTGEEKAGDSALLVGYRGRLYEMDDDFQMVRQGDPFASVGCGSNVAMGAMYMGEVAFALSPEEKIVRALEAAARYHCGVCGPFDVQVLEAK